MILAEVQAKRASGYPALASVVQTADLWELTTVPQCGGCTSWDSESLCQAQDGFWFAPSRREGFPDSNWTR